MIEVDYLNQRTTNINVRISPMLKTQLIEQGAKQGLNLSDYIMHLLTIEVSGGNDKSVSDFEEYQELLNEKKNIERKLNRFEEETARLDKFIGKLVYVDGVEKRINNKFDMLEAIFNTVKYSM